MRYFALAALTVVCVAAAARGQHYSAQPAGYAHGAMSELDAARADFDAQLAELERQLAEVEHGGGGCCDPCCRGTGWFGSAQAVWLKPHHADGTGLAIEEAGLGTDYEVTPRLELGYARCDGLGFRVRYWEFDHAFSGEFDLDGQVTLVHDWDTWVGDIEVTDSTRLGCNWDATFSAGYRHVEYDEALSFTRGSTFSFGKSFQGDGVTVAAELRHAVCCNWGVFANSRASALYGDEEFAAVDDGVVEESLRQENNVKYIWEAQAGVEWMRCLPCGGYVFARGFGEVQYWDSFGMGLALEDESDLLRDSSVGFAGFGVALGVVR